MFRFFSAIGRMISNALTKLGLKAEAKADQQFTKDAESKAMAFDLYGEDLEKDFHAQADALSEAEVAVQTKRDLKVTKGKSLTEAHEALQGALTAYEDAQRSHAAAKTDGDRAKYQKEMDDAQKDGTTFQDDINRLTKELAELEVELEGHESKLEELLGQLEDIQKEIANLPMEKAQAINDHIANTKLKEAYERAAGLRKTTNRRPIDAVLEDNKKLAAQTKVAGKIAGVDADKKRDKYIAKGRQDTAGTDFQKMLAARAAQKQQATGDKPVTEQPATTDERPKI